MIMWFGIIITAIASVVCMVAIAMGVEGDEPLTVTIPPMPTYAPRVISVEAECLCDECCHAQAVNEFTDEFTALFNSYETKWSKNGRLMIRKGNSGSYRFVKRAA